MILVKIGGSAITDKEKEKKFDAKKTEKIAKLLKGQEMVIVHGGGSFGHAIAKKYQIHEGVKGEKQLLGLCRTQEAMQDLNSLVIKALLKEGIPAFPVQASGFVLMKKGKVLKADLTAVKKLAELGTVPVLYGVPAADTEQGYSILSGDELVYILAKELRPEKVILVTDVKGVYEKNPKTDMKARLLKEVTKKSLNKIEFQTNAKDVTGGMERKLRELLELAEQGIGSVITDAEDLEKVIKGEKAGTKVR